MRSPIKTENTDDGWTWANRMGKSMGENVLKLENTTVMRFRGKFGVV